MIKEYYNFIKFYNQKQKIIVILTMASRSRKLVYLLFIGGLTTTTLSAAYWQTSRFYQSKERWQVISKELNN